MGNKELTAPESSWIYSHVMSSFFLKYCGILTCSIHGYDFVSFKLARKKRTAMCQSLPLACQEIQSTAIQLISINTVHLDKNNKKQQKQAVERAVCWADSHIVMIKHKSGAACKAVSYIYGTIMSRLPKSYKWLDAIQGDKPLPGAR